jgi:transcriptional regulator with XRE-family HTH domain
MITVDFGNRIRELRLQQEISQEKFALKIGMDRTYYASVESGKRNISLINIKKIADGFGISISDLFNNL